MDLQTKSNLEPDETMRPVLLLGNRFSKDSSVHFASWLLALNNQADAVIVKLKGSLVPVS